MNSNDTWPNAPHRISSRVSIHNLRACNCKFCLGPAMVKKINTSQDRTPTRLTAEDDGGRDEIDRHHTMAEGLQNPDLNASNTRNIDIQLKPGGSKRLSLSMPFAGDTLDESDSSRKAKSCPSSPDNAETTMLTFDRSITKSTQEIVRIHKVVSYDSENYLGAGDKTAEPVKAKTLSHLFSSALWNIKALIGVGTLVLVCAIFMIQVSGNTSDSYDPRGFSNDLNRLREDFKLTNESLLSFKAGLQFIKQESSTSCIILSYGDKYKVPSEDSSFIESISSAAAKYLRNSTKADPIILDQEELSVADQEYLQANYRHALEDRSVMAVKHLESLPARTALAFHYFCDEYYPLVKNTAIILLFDTRKCDIGNTNDVPANALEHVERCLTRQWSQIDDDELKPLLTRVVNVVIDLDKV